MDKIVRRLERMNDLILIKGTGNPEQFASRLRISPRTLYESLDLMKRLGAPIAYCKGRQSYYYSEEGEFTIGFLKGSNE